MGGECREQPACVPVHTHAHTHTQRKLVHRVHTDNHKRQLCSHTLPAGADWAPLCVHTHWQRTAGAGGRRRGATRLQDGGSAGGCAGSELLFTAQSPVCCYSNQPPNRETDITAREGEGRGLRTGGSVGGEYPTGGQAAAENRVVGGGTPGEEQPGVWGLKGKDGLGIGDPWREGD